MSENNQEFHEYDGIKELDNPMPAWWLWTFAITIIFSFLYYIHYETGAGPTLTQELDVAMKEIQAKQASHQGAPESNEDFESLVAQADPSLGVQAYAQKCAACHGDQLQGLIGPNLTDKFWIHGKGTKKDIATVIRQGVVEKGMPGWENLLKKEEVYSLVALILSKKNSHPAGEKAPQGEPVE